MSQTWTHYDEGIPYAFALQDTDQAGIHDARDMFEVYNPDLFPCFEWGISRQLAYKMNLSRVVSVCIVFDVVVVPNSLWLKVFFDGHVQIVLQIIEDDNQEVFVSNQNQLRLIGWKRDSFALRDDE